MYDLPPPDPAAEVVIATRGISKGLAQTDGPQFLVRGELGFGAIYVGAYAKNVTSPTSDGEAGALVGLRTKRAGFELSASAAVKRALAPVGKLDSTALELSGAVSRKFGRLTPRISVTWSPDDLGSTTHSVYAEGALGFAVDKSTNISAAVARRERGSGPDYTAYNFGIGRTFGGKLTLDVRYFDTDKSGLGTPFKGRIVGSARLRF
jgi:uncharacterized protein (TIGR02001 family)